MENEYINADGKAYDGRKGPINVALIFTAIAVYAGIFFIVSEYLF